MKKSFIFFIAACVPLFFLTGFIPSEKAKKTKVLIITGGHGFEHAPFYDVFNAIPTISYDSITQPQANALIASAAINIYDVLIFYDLVDSLTAEQQQAYINLLNKGKAMLFLHHSLVSYQHWPEFIKIVGGQYHTEPVLVNGDTLRANYEHDVTIPVKVENKHHPILKGINDFEIIDEIYGGSEILPTITPLLSTTHPKSMHYVAWINHYGKSDVLYIQLGHGPPAFSNPVYRKLIRQAVEWSAAKHASVK